MQVHTSSMHTHKTEKHPSIDGCHKFPFPVEEDTTSPFQSNANIRNFLEKDIVNIKRESWTRLDKTTKLKKLREFLEKEVREERWTQAESDSTYDYIRSCLDKKRPHHKKTVKYDVTTEKVVCIKDKDVSINNKNTIKHKSSQPTNARKTLKHSSSTNGKSTTSSSSFSSPIEPSPSLSPSPSSSCVEGVEKMPTTTSQQSTTLDS